MRKHFPGKMSKALASILINGLSEDCGDAGMFPEYQDFLIQSQGATGV